MASTHLSRTLGLSLADKEKEKKLTLELKNDQGEVIVIIDDSMLPASESDIPIAILECGGLLMSRSLDELGGLGFTIVGKNEKEQQINRHRAAIQLFDHIIGNSDDSFHSVQQEAVKGKEKAEASLYDLTETKEVKEDKFHSDISPAVTHIMPKLRKGFVIVSFDMKLIPTESDSYFQVREKLNDCLHLLRNSDNYEALEEKGIVVKGATSHQQNMHKHHAIKKLEECLFKHENNSILHLLRHDEEGRKRYENLKRDAESGVYPNSDDSFFDFSVENKTLARLHSYYCPFDTLKPQERFNRILHGFYLMMNISDITRLNTFGIELLGSTHQKQEINRLKILIGLCAELYAYKSYGFNLELIENMPKWQIEFKENLNKKESQLSKAVPEKRQKLCLFVTQLPSSASVASSTPPPTRPLSPTPGNSRSTSSSSSSSSSGFLPSIRR